MNADLAAQRAFDRLDGHGFDALSETGKILATVWKFEAGVTNGGFFHTCSSAAFARIGARRLAALSAGANALFGPGGPPRSRNARCGILDILSDSARSTFESPDTEFLKSTDNRPPPLDACPAQARENQEQH